jgi:glycosyltransferase involved in cell wall biosynthesis
MARTRNGRRIALVTMDVRLADEPKGLDRTAYIAGTLAEAGYEVDLITSSFQHWEKAQRNTADERYRNLPFHVVFIDAPSYKKNLELARVRNHAQVAKQVAVYLDAHPDYDLVLAKIPPNDLARVCGEFCQAHGIPFVVDVNDLWPEAMRMVLDVPVVSDALFHPFLRDAEAAYRLADAAIGTSDEYALRPQKRNGREIPHITVYVGNDVAAFDAEAATNAGDVHKPEGAFWVTYAGTIGKSYDIRTLVEAAAELAGEGHDDVRFMVLGGGPEKEQMEALAREKGAPVTFPGYLPHAQMAAYLAASDILVNSFIKRASQCIVSKIGDYLAAGKPMINTLDNAEFCAKVEHDGFGVNVPPEAPADLAGAILALKDDPGARTRMGAAARAVAETQFDRPQSYRRIVELVDELV